MSTNFVMSVRLLISVLLNLAIGFLFFGSVLATSVLAVPNAPTDVTAVAQSSSSIQLTWTDNATDETGFIVERSTSETSGYVLVGEPAIDATSFLDEGLPDHSMTYYYRVAAKGATTAENSAFTTAVSATTLGPEPPSALTATEIGAKFITLGWQDNTNSETAFVIERAPGGNTSFALVGEVDADILTFTDNGVEPQTAYDYRAAARVDGQLTDYSTVLSVTTAAPDLPAAPTSLTATVLSPTEIRINWLDASDNELGFQIQRSDFVSSAFKNEAEVAANVKSFTFTDLISNSDYWFKVVAFNNDGESAASNTVNAKTDVDVPAQATNLQISAITIEGFEMQWEDNSDVESSYRIDIRQQGDFSTLSELEANAESFTVTGLEKATTYTVRVAAVNETGESFSDEVSTTTLDEPPEAPSDLTLSIDDTGTEITLTWVDNSDNEEGFDIERSIDDTENFEDLEEADVDETEYIDTIEPNQKVFYRIRSFNLADSSDYSNITGTVIASTTDELLESFSMYPNPTNGLVKLSFGVEVPIAVRVYNYTGQQFKLYDVRGQQSLDIDLSQRPIGLYFIKVDFKANSITKKVLLTR